MELQADYRKGGKQRESSLLGTIPQFHNPDISKPTHKIPVKSRTRRSRGMKWHLSFSGSAPKVSCQWEALRGLLRSREHNKPGTLNVGSKVTPRSKLSGNDGHRKRLRRGALPTAAALLGGDEQTLRKSLISLPLTLRATHSSESHMWKLREWS